MPHRAAFSTISQNLRTPCKFFLVVLVLVLVLDWVSGLDYEDEDDDEDDSVLPNASGPYAFFDLLVSSVR